MNHGQCDSIYVMLMIVWIVWVYDRCGVLSVWRCVWCSKDFVYSYFAFRFAPQLSFLPVSAEGYSETTTVVAYTSHSTLILLFPKLHFKSDWQHFSLSFFIINRKQMCQSVTITHKSFKRSFTKASLQNDSIPHHTYERGCFNMLDMLGMCLLYDMSLARTLTENDSNAQAEEHCS